MSARSRWHDLPTEAVNPLSRKIDTLSARQIVNVMILDDRNVLAAVRRERRQIARGAELIASALHAGGRIVLVGAGTSGRLGVLEAAELPPTFGIAPKTVRAIMAGAARAVHRAREGVEDDGREGARVMHRLRLGPKDVVIGISASGVTPFVRAAVDRARAAGASVIGVTCDARSPLKRQANVIIVLRVGPEVIAGSTRLKAGTATKIVLNMLTTTAMVRAGKTYGNLMVDVKAGSDKLRDRARRIVGLVTALGPSAVETLLRRSGWNAKVAIVMHDAGLSRAAAVSRLRAEPRLRKHLRRR